MTADARTVVVGYDVSHELLRISDRPVTVIGPRCAELRVASEQ